MERQFFTKLDRYGRITIPAELRRALRMRPGTRLVLTAMKGYILVETRAAWARRTGQTRPPTTRPKGSAQSPR